jgi:predicted RNase H-like HicB family nuclease
MRTRKNTYLQPDFDDSYRFQAVQDLKHAIVTEENMKYRVLIEQDEDGVFVAEVPSLPGCISQGNTRTESLRNVQEAITAYLESLKAHNEPIPPSIYEEVVEVSV